MTIPGDSKMHTFVDTMEIYSMRIYSSLSRYIYVPTDFFTGRRTGSRPIGLPQSRLISGLCGTTWHGLPRGDFYMNGPCMSMYMASYIDI